MNKIREWWIEFGQECDDIVWHKDTGLHDTVHVIDATGMPTKEEIRLALDTGDWSGRARDAHDKVKAWLEKLAAE